MNDETNFHSNAEPIIAGACSPADIKRAELALGVSITGEYKEFLLNHGALIANGKSIYGLFDLSSNDPPLWDDLIDVNIMLRKNNQIGSENRNFIAISDDGQGTYYFLDTKSSNTNIHAIGPDVNKIVSTSLDDFISNYSGSWWR